MMLKEDLTPKERKSVCGKCEDIADCTEDKFVCEKAEWKLEKKKLNERLAAKTYPEQSPYVHGNKIWLSLPNEQEVVVSAQARDYLDWNEIDEAKFIQKLKELLTECFYDYKPTDKEWIWMAERVSVSRVADYWDEPDEDGNRQTHLTIEIKELHGKQRKDVTSLCPSGEKRE